MIMNATPIRRFFMLLGIIMLTLSMSPQAEPCSRVLWSDNGKAVVVGRNMDWVTPMPVNLYALPRGIKRNGMTGKNTLTWTAKYGTVVAESSDGMNEKGLAGHMLWLAESEYGAFDPNRPGLSVGLWLQYYLDNFATVKEAVEFTEKTPFQLVTGTFDGRKVTVHLAFEDPSGDSAVIEYIGGKPRVHHGKEYTVMTNSPPYDEQLKNLRQFKGFGGDKPLPGTTDAADRFVRAAYYLKNLPEPKDYRECIAGELSVMRNVSQPFGVADPARPNISATRWRTIGDLTNMVYYFESATSPYLVWVKLKELDFSEGTGIRKLDLVRDPDRIGDCTKQFGMSQPFFIPPPDLK
jgi:choloylglycine hydrolase